jgi:hypothetical protein
MLHMEFTQKHVGSRQRRSETEHRLYWSRYYRMACQAPAPRRKIQAWMGVGQLFAALQRGWHARTQSDMRASEQGSQTHSLITKEGKV